MLTKDFISQCKAIGGKIEDDRCVKHVSFVNRLNQLVERIVEVVPVKEGNVVIEGNRWDSGFDTHIFVPTHKNAFDLAKQIIDAEGNPVKMYEIATEKLFEYDARILDPSDKRDSKILEQIV